MENNELAGRVPAEPGAREPSPQAVLAVPASPPRASIIVHNVSDRRHDWIGPWEIEAEPIDTAKLWAGDEGRTVIYRSHNNAEAGTLSSWNAKTVWARFHKGDTAAACTPSDLHFAIRDATPDYYRPPASAIETRSAMPQADAQSQGESHD